MAHWYYVLLVCIDSVSSTRAPRADCVFCVCHVCSVMCDLMSAHNLTGPHRPQPSWCMTWFLAFPQPVLIPPTPAPTPVWGGGGGWGGGVGVNTQYMLKVMLKIMSKSKVIPTPQSTL